MSLLINKMTGVCWKCTEKITNKKANDPDVKPLTRSYDLTRGMVTNRYSSEIVDCWECRECHNLVPVSSWRTYAATGDIVLKVDKKILKERRGK